jgi:hypothetical protein
MRILLGFNQHHHKGEVVPSYAGSFDHELARLGHEVVPYGAGHEEEHLEDINTDRFDLLIELDSGRDKEGKLSFQQHDCNVKIPSAVWFIDSHGHPDMHRKMAKHYGFVFFAVWDKRDIFTADAHWLPNATDLWWFSYYRFMKMAKRGDKEPIYDPEFQFGFFGSKGGLDRADPLKEICERRGWSYDIRQINKPWKHMWPHTGEAMYNCANLFNHGQKHDAPNLRVMESMAVRRPLITDVDPRSGMERLFKPYEHFFPYNAYTYEGLEETCDYVLKHPEEAQKVAQQAHDEVLAHHQVKHRVIEMMSVICSEL